MLARTALIASLLVAPATERPRADREIWDAVRTCLDRNLRPFLGTPETSQNVFRTVRTICDDAVEDALALTALRLAERLGASPARGETEAAEPFLRRRMDGVLLAYVVKYRAVGGPTTLDP